MFFSARVWYSIIWIIFYLYSMMNGLLIPKGSPITIILNSLIFTYFFIYSIFRPYLIIKFAPIYLYIFFLLILIILSSSEYFASFRMWTKYSISLMCLPVSFDIFKNKNSPNEIWGLFRCFIFLFLINYLICNVFHLGGDGYTDDISGIELGNLMDDSLHTNICVMAFVPLALIIKAAKRKLFLILYVIFSIVLTIVILKRTPIVCIGIAILTYFAGIIYLSNLFGKIDTSNLRLKIRTKFVAIISVIILGSLFSTVLYRNFEARSDRFNRGLAKEGRTRELIAISEDVLLGNDKIKYLFGQETFNTVGTYAGGKFKKRMIHDNFGIIINGAGIIGLLFYIFINMYLLFLLIRNLNKDKVCKNGIAYFYIIIYISYWLMYQMTSLSGTIWLMLYPSMTFSVMGMILRYFADGAKMECISDDE